MRDVLAALFASCALSAGCAKPAPAATSDAGTTATPPAVDDLAGKPAPDFTAQTQTGATVHLASLKGHPVVLYFYPKDETSGCTREAQDFRDNWDAITRTGATLIGVSADSLESHKAFAEHHKLPFLLVSDPNGAIAQSYGVPFTMFIKRQTIVIGPDGVVRKVFRSVDVAMHAGEVLDALNHLS